MALSKKHYKHFASIIKTAYEEEYSKLENTTCASESIHAITGIYHNLCEYFKSDNPRFNEDTFQKATIVDPKIIEELRK